MVHLEGILLLAIISIWWPRGNSLFIWDSVLCLKATAHLLPVAPIGTPTNLFHTPTLPLQSFSIPILS